MAKIIQILTHEGDLLGLGDDGVIYSPMKGVWSECIDALPETESKLPATTKKRSAAFKVPDKNEVSLYMAERGLGPVPALNEAENFCNFYESKGWKVGKNKMKSWPASVRNWLKNYNPQQGGNYEKGQQPVKQRALSTAERIAAANGLDPRTMQPIENGHSGALDIDGEFVREQVDFNDGRH